MGSDELDSEFSDNDDPSSPPPPVDPAHDYTIHAQSPPAPLPQLPPSEEDLLLSADANASLEELSNMLNHSEFLVPIVSSTPAHT